MVARSCKPQRPWRGVCGAVCLSVAMWFPPPSRFPLNFPASQPLDLSTGQIALPFELQGGVLKTAFLPLVSSKAAILWP